AVNVKDHRVAACKVIVLTAEITDKKLKTIEKEKRVHAQLKHSNILEFMDAVVVELKHQQHFVPVFYMAAGGDWFDKIAPDIGVGDEVAHYHFNELIAGMIHYTIMFKDYIHKEGVCYRDLKPKNLLLDVGGALKISEFGHSFVFRLKETGQKRTLTERCGSLPYVTSGLNGDRPYEAEPIDVRGVRVIFYPLLAGNIPCDKQTAHSPEFSRYASREIFQEEPWNRFNSHAFFSCTKLG
ncbi:kinase-like domain-containing protein, partial [Mycena capillaripes]